MQTPSTPSIPTASLVGVGLLLALGAGTVQPVGAQEHRHSMGEAAHLTAHLATRALLTEEQRMRYAHHRGYAGSPEHDGS